MWVDENKLEEKGNDRMKKILLLLTAFLVSCGAVVAASQEKSKASEPPKDQVAPTTPLRVQVVFAEYDGDKKIVSLPYSFSVNADERRATSPGYQSRPGTQIREGARIPVSSGKEQWQYLDVGTNIDCSAQSQGDGRYKLSLSLERSSVSQETSGTGNPVIRSFRADVNPILKDGQTFETIMATDPANGHVYRVTVTLNVPK